MPMLDHGNLITFQHRAQPQVAYPVTLPFLTSGSRGSYMVTLAEPISPARDPAVSLGNRSSWPRREKAGELRSTSAVHNLHLERAMSSMVMNLTEVSFMVSAVVQLASGSTEPASMSAWGLLLIATGLLLRVMRFRATRSKAESRPLEPIRPLASSMPR